jgi:hypothetical protein
MQNTAQRLPVAPPTPARLQRLQLDLHAGIEKSPDNARLPAGRVAVDRSMVDRIKRRLAIEQVEHRAMGRDMLVDVVVAGQIKIGE